MAIQNPTSFTASGIAVDLLTTDSIIVGTGITLISTGNSAIVNAGSNQFVAIYGTVEGWGGPGVRLGDGDTDIGNQVWIGGGARLIGETGLRVEGAGARIENAGEISSRGTTNGISLSASGTAKTTITNSGLIAGNSAIFFGGGETVPVDIFNRGLLVGRSTEALDGNGYQGAIRLFNTGLIYGIAQLGEKSDYYDGRGGRVLGAIQGLGGNDVFIPGAAGDVIDGGSNLLGGDTLDFRSLGGTHVALDNTIAKTGNATGDIYSGIENIQGSNTGNDFLIGDGGLNILSGNGGNDLVFGRAGIDILNGNAGNDILSGGLGADTMNGGTGIDKFRYDGTLEGGDTITIFETVDFFLFKSAIFGGLPAGTLAANRFFVNATGNTAANTTQRFIFEADSDRLWYDSNGSATGGTVVMIADLSNNFALSNLDIQIFA